jgi:predicted transposase/invertase (TIGR01784 family)
MSQNEEIRELSEAREQWLFDQALRENAAKEAGIAEGKIEGIAEGIVEGKQQAIREMVQRIYKSGFNLEEIARITTLPEEEIQKIILTIIPTE